MTAPQVPLAAGRRHSLAVVDGGRVLAAGPPGAAECAVACWSDVVAVAAGNVHAARNTGRSHSVGLRADAVVRSPTSRRCSISIPKGVPQSPMWFCRITVCPRCSSVRRAGQVRVAQHLVPLDDHRHPGEQLHAAVGEYPAINQVELHPNFQQKQLRAIHEEHGIVTEAWSPLGQGGDILSDATIDLIKAIDVQTTGPAALAAPDHAALADRTGQDPSNLRRAVKRAAPQRQ